MSTTESARASSSSNTALGFFVLLNAAVRAVLVLAGFIKKSA